MKKRILIFFIFFSYWMYSQEVFYPKGIYMNRIELSKKSPSNLTNIELMKLTEGKIKMNGGNDYQLKSIDKSIKRKILKKEVYAYSDGKNLYLNCQKLELRKWYTKVLSENKSYFIFKAAIPLYPEKYGYKIADFPNVFGGIVGGIHAANLALVRLPYIMKKSTKKVTLVTSKNIINIMKGNENLIKEFKEEKDKNNLNTIINYLLKWSN